MTMNPDLLNPAATTNARVSAVAAMTAPLPADKAATTKHYICTVPSASMFRADGKKLPFVFGYLSTDIKYDQEHLDAEIANGNPYVRYATDDEIQAANMRMDPRGTLRREIEAELREELEAQIRAEQQAVGGVSDAAKIAGTDTVSNALQRLKTGVKSGTGTVIPSAGAAPALGGIVSSADVADSAASSGK